MGNGIGCMQGGCLTRPDIAINTLCPLQILSNLLFAQAGVFTKLGY